MNRVHFSSKSDEYETPDWLFDLLDSEVGGFDVDVSADRVKAKCKLFYSKEVDGLKQDWRGKKCWNNPPYSEIGPWIEKSYLSSLEGATVYCLIPARTDTTYWHRWVTKAYEIRFLKGRIKFGNEKNGAPFPSAIVIFKPGKHQEPRIRFVDLDEVRRSLFGC